MKIYKTTIIGKGYGMNQRERQIFKAGFTLVELLTVMAIIAILISLLVPAVNLVRGYASEVKQKAQFHSIDVGMNLYKNDFGDYPPSNDNGDILPTANQVKDSDGTVRVYGGAQKLAEAMVGWDLLGYHPKSVYGANGKSTRDDGSGAGTVEEFWVYHAGLNDAMYPARGENAADNLKSRKGPYLELENANALKMEDVYGLTNLGTFPQVTNAQGETITNYVLCDSFLKTRPSGKKTGMPVLYYKARTAYTQQNYQDALAVADDIYYYGDNDNLVGLGIPVGAIPFEAHPMFAATGTVPEAYFESRILDPKMTRGAAGPTAFQRPYKVDSYILISAGQDGKYGTGDDIFNFEKE